jgi:hypothetical protein
MLAYWRWAAFAHPCMHAALCRFTVLVGDCSAVAVLPTGKLAACSSTEFQDASNQQDSYIGVMHAVLRFLLASWTLRA